MYAALGSPLFFFCKCPRYLDNPTLELILWMGRPHLTHIQTIKYSFLQYHWVLYNAVQFDMIPYISIQYSRAPYSTVKFHVVQYLYGGVYSCKVKCIVPNSFRAMSDLENPSNKSDFYVKNGLNRTEIWLILAKYLTFLHKYKKIRKY